MPWNSDARGEISYYIDACSLERRDRTSAGLGGDAAIARIMKIARFKRQAWVAFGKSIFIPVRFWMRTRKKCGKSWCASPVDTRTKPDSLFRAKFCPSTQVNSAWLRTALSEASRSYLSSFASSAMMNNMITKASRDMGIAA